jgi:two-component system CheB/CheR fusion protein
VPPLLDEARAARTVGSPPEVARPGAAWVDALLSSMRDPAVVVAGDGKILFATAAYEDVAARAGLVVDDDTIEAGAALPALLRRAARGECFTTPLRGVGAAGEHRWYEAVGQSFGRAGDGGLVVLRDVSDRRIRERQDEFIAILAHELRTPLTALQGYIQLLLANPSEAARYAELTVAQLERMRTMIAELFDTARIESGALTLEEDVLSLDELVGDCVRLAELLSQRHRVDVTEQVPGLRVRGDRRRLEQVFLNVIGNAITHAPEAGRLTVRIRVAGEDAAEVEVEDQGPGVPPDQLDSIFDRFRRTTASAGSTSGLGLGLFIARQIVLAHGGAIDAASDPGCGLTIRIRLPRVAEVDAER